MKDFLLYAFLLGVVAYGFYWVGRIHELLKHKSRRETDNDSTSQTLESLKKIRRQP